MNTIVACFEESFQKTIYWFEFGSPTYFIAVAFSMQKECSEIWKRLKGCNLGIIVLELTPKCVGTIRGLPLVGSVSVLASGSLGSFKVTSLLWHNNKARNFLIMLTVAKLNHHHGNND